MLAARRHEVDHAHRAVADARTSSPARSVSGRYRRLTRAAVRGRREQPAAVLGAAEERGKAGCRVEPGQAEPVDRARPRDERCRLAGRRSARSPRSSRIEVCTAQTQSCQRELLQPQCLFFTPQSPQSQYSHQIQRRCWISSTIMQAIAKRSRPGDTREDRNREPTSQWAGRPIPEALEAQPESGAAAARPRRRRRARRRRPGPARGCTRSVSGSRSARRSPPRRARGTPRSAPPPPRRPARSYARSASSHAAIRSA